MELMGRKADERLKLMLNEKNKNARSLSENQHLEGFRCRFIARHLDTDVIKSVRNQGS